MSYGIVLLMAVLGMAWLFRGFFWQYLFVRRSGGRKVLVKLRGLARDYFRVGVVEEGFIVFKGTDGKRRVAVPDQSYFYRSLSVNWIDVDDQKSVVVRPDYQAYAGYDAEKTESLNVRCLYKPQIVNSKEILIVVLIALVIIMVGISIYMGYKNAQGIEAVRVGLAALPQSPVSPGGL